MGYGLSTFDDTWRQTRNSFKGRQIGVTEPTGRGPTWTWAGSSRSVRCWVAAMASLRDILSPSTSMAIECWRARKIAQKQIERYKDDNEPDRMGIGSFWNCKTKKTNKKKQTHGLQTVLGPKVFFLVFLSAVSKPCWKKKQTHGLQRVLGWLGCFFCFFLCVFVFFVFFFTIFFVFLGFFGFFCYVTLKHLVEYTHWNIVFLH